MRDVLLSTMDRPRKLLFLAHRVPYPPDKGDRIRSWNMLRHLARRHRVWLGCLADEPLRPDSEATLQSVCEDVRIVPVAFTRWLRGGCALARGTPVTTGVFSSSALRRWVRAVARAQQFDAVIAYCSSMAGYAAVSELRGVPLIVDLVDVDSEKWRSLSEMAVWPLGSIYRHEWRTLQQYERQLGRLATSMLLVSEAEAELHQQYAPDSRVQVVGNGVNVEYFRQSANGERSSRKLVFVGALDYAPNVQAMRWFCDSVWPRLRQSLPDLELDVVGRSPSRTVQSLARLAGVTIYADVPDVRPYLQRAAISIAPLQIARGIQNKVLESLASETPVVASPAALEGLELTPGREVIQAETPDDWVTAILSLCQDEPARRRLAHLGRLFVEQHYRWDDRLRPLDELLEAILGSASAQDTVTDCATSASV